MIKSYFTEPFGRVAYPDDLLSLFNNPSILSYNDAALSGTPKAVRFFYHGAWYYGKAYPTAAAELGGSGDSAGDEFYAVDDIGLSGSPVVFSVISGGTEYFFKGFPVVGGSPSYHAGTFSLPLTQYVDTALSGTPRVAKALIGGTPYYWKIYPTKS